MTKTTGYVAIHAIGAHIDGVGATAEGAIATALKDAGPLFGPNGEDIPEAEQLAQYHALPATPALLSKIEAEGGAIGWDEHNDIAHLEIEERLERFDLDTLVMEALAREKFGCEHAEVEDDFSIWIANPQRGHWLSDHMRHELADFIDARREAEGTA